MDGYHFPAGTVSLLSQWVIHNIPDIWGDPEAFRPERWDPLNGQKVPQWAYFPFGGGPRFCIGQAFAQMEAVLLLATLARSFGAEVLPKPRVVPFPSVTLRPKHGIPVRLVRRMQSMA